MKFTLSWLKDHLETSASLEKICETLTMIGLEVEQVTDRSSNLKSFTVAKIIAAEKHPEADKLRVCRVESDIGELQIVCGAPNARAGMHVVLAKEGAVIPHGGMVIKKTKIRGVESSGMLCSAEELALGGDSSGIIELPETSKIGEAAARALGLDDPVIDIAVTPNRADCLSVIGIGRDLSAAGMGKRKINQLYEPQKVLELFRSIASDRLESPVKVTIESPHCQQFIGFYIQGITNGHSPDWLRKRLEAIGQRSISALVDITNYLMLDLGRPMHVYDADKLKGNIKVRHARQGERFKALDGNEYKLLPSMTVISDDAGVLGLAGIMGGEESSCSENTKNVFLEMALFDQVNIAETGRILGILSDARYRFERGVDADQKIGCSGYSGQIAMKAEVAAYVIHKYCGGKVSRTVNAGVPPEWVRTITFRPERIKTLGGINLADKAKTILTSLGFECTFEKDSWTVSPPSWRADIEGEADLIEEILRIHGYGHIPPTPMPPLPVIGKPTPDAVQQRAHRAKRVLASRGMLECCSWSFLPEAQAKLFGGNHPQLKLLNPISADLDTMRPSLLPNLLSAAKKNAFRGFRDLALFEAGLQFHDVTPDGQRMVAAGIRSGHIAECNYQEGLFQHKDRPVDAFDAKTDALAVLQALSVSKCEITAHTPPWYHPGRSGALTLGKIILGYFGEIHPALLPLFDIESGVAAFEIFLDAIPASRAKGNARPPLKLSDFQAVERDFAFTVPGSVTAADIIKTIAQADKQLITDVAIFDVYTGKGIDGGKKSVAVKVTLQAMDRTLSEQDIAVVSQAVIAAAAKGFGGQLRQ